MGSKGVQIRRFTFNVAIAMNCACPHSMSPTTSSTVAGNVPNRSRNARFTGVGNFGATRNMVSISRDTIEGLY